jgi:hypothetical protein
MIFFLSSNLESVCFCVPAQVDKWHFQTRDIEPERIQVRGEKPLFFFGIINENSQGLFAGLQGWLGPVEGATNGGQKAMRQTSPKLKVLGAGEGYSAETEAVKPPKLEDRSVSHLRVCECCECCQEVEDWRK